MELEIPDIENWLIRATALIILIITLARILKKELVDFWREF